jgi:hypothetical protein
MGNGEESRTEGPLNNIFCCHASLVINIQFLQLNLSGKSTEQGFLYYIFLYSSIYLISELLKKLLVLVLGRPPSCDWCLFDKFLWNILFPLDWIENSMTCFVKERLRWVAYVDAGVYCCFQRGTMLIICHCILMLRIPPLYLMDGADLHNLI